MSYLNHLTSHPKCPENTATAFDPRFVWHARWSYHLGFNKMLNLFAFDTFSTLLMPAIAVWNTYGRRHNMAKSIRRIEAAARAANLEMQVEQMPDSTRTATQAAKACGCHVGQIIK
jgi:hypothetical protein